MKLQLVDSIDPILRTPTEPFDFSNPPMDPLDLVSDLAEAMLASGGIGIAANQCGIPYSVFVIYGTELIPCFNPRIVDASEEMITLEEGCLSYPGLAVKVKRPKKIKVRYQEPNGETVTRVFDGITARVFQHELSHLRGVCHLDEASYIHKQQALTRWKKLKRQQKALQK